MTVQTEALRSFAQIPILSSLTEEEIFDFVRLCKVLNFSDGDRLFKQGERGRSMFLIEYGAVEVILEREEHRETLQIFGANEVVGELSLLDPEPRSATGIVREDTRVYEVQGELFDELLRQHHPAAHKIVQRLTRIICRRIRAINERIEVELIRRDAATSSLGEAANSDSMLPGVSQEPQTRFKRLLNRVWRGEDR